MSSTTSGTTLTSPRSTVTSSVGVHSVSAPLPEPFKNGSTLTLRAQVSKCLHFLGDSEVLFCSSPTTLTRASLMTRGQSHVYASNDATCITALAVSPDFATVAWAEFTHDCRVVVCTADLGPLGGPDSAFGSGGGGGGGGGGGSGSSSSSSSPMRGGGGTMEGASAISSPRGKTRRSRRVITCVDTAPHQPLTCLAFSGDGKHLLIPSAPPNVTLHCIAWEAGTNGKLVAHGKGATGLGAGNPHPIVQVSTHPKDHTRMAVCGKGTLRQFKLPDASAKNAEVMVPLGMDLKEVPSTNFTCHAWVGEDHLVVCTLEGGVYVFEGTTLKRAISHPKDSLYPGPQPVHSLLASAGGGFVTGCDGGLIRVYEKAEVPSHLFKVHGSFVVENVGVGAGAGATLPPGPVSRVTTLAVSSNQDELCVVVGSGGAYLFPLGSYELAKKAAVAAALKREKDASGAHPKPLSLFRPLLAPFLPLWPGAVGGSEGMSRAAATASLLSGSLGGPLVITSPLAGTHFQPLAVNPLAALTTRPPPPTGLLGVSIALRRPLAVTISADKSLRVWNLTGVAVVSQQVVGGDGTNTSESPVEHKTPSSPDGNGGDGGGDGGGVDGPGRGALSPFVTPALECIHVLESMPTSVALHPMGDTALVATEANVGVYNLRLGGVKCLREVPLRGITAVRFNGTGGMWAAAGSSGAINVYMTYGGALVGTLKGHKEAVVSLVWGKEDRSLASVSKDGTVILWAVTVPNAVAGGSVPPSSRAAFSSSVVVSSEALRAEGTVRPSVLQLAFKAVSVVENENLAPTALAFGPGEGEVVVAGIIKDDGGGGGRGGKGVKFSASAGQTLGGGAASDAPDPTGPVLIRLYMLQISDEKGRVSGGGGGSAAPSSSSSSAASATLSSLSKSLGGGSSSSSSSSAASSSSSKSSSKGKGSAVGLMAQSAFVSRLVLPVQGGAPIRSLETVYVDIPGSSSPTPTATPLLFAGMGHRIPDASDSDLRAQLFYAFSGQTPPQGATPAYAQTLANAYLANALLSAEAHLLPPLTKALTARDPVGGVRAYRFPLISAATSGAAFSPVPSKPEAPLATHPLGYFEKGGMKGHGGPCLALGTTVGESGHVWSVGADGGLLQWCVDGEAIGRILEAVKGSSGLAVAASNALALAVAVGNGEVASTASAAAAAVSARSSPPSLGNPLGGGALGSNWLPWSDTIFVGGELLATLERSKAELSRRLKELNAANKHAARVRETELRGAMEEVEERYEEELLNARESTDESRANKQDSEDRGAAAMGSLEERQAEEAEAVKRAYAGKLAGEEARCERKSKEKAALVAEEEARLEALVKANALALADLKELQAEEMEAARDELRGLQEARVELESQGRVKEGLMEVGLDNDLEDIRAKLEVRVLAEAKATAGLRGENALIKQRFGALHAALERAQEELGACGDVEAGLEGRIKGLEKDHATLIKELGERDAMLEEKNVRILEVKRRTQELEKFKFVLNYKIQELKRAVMPRKRDIANLRVTLGEMETELLQVHKSSSLLSIMVGELEMKKAGCDRARAQAQASEVSERERLSNIQRDMVSLWDLAKEAHRLHALAQAALAPPPLSPGGGSAASSQAPKPPTAADTPLLMAASAEAKRLRNVLVSLYKKYILGEVTAGGGHAAASLLPTFDEASGALVFPVGAAPDEVAEDVARSRAFLEKAVAGLQLKVEKDAQLSKKGAVRLMGENTSLLKELNDLRRALRFTWGECIKASQGVGVGTPRPDLEEAYRSAMDNVEGEEGEGETGGAPTPTPMKIPPPSSSPPSSSSSSTTKASGAASSTATALFSTRRSAALLGVVGLKGLPQTK